MKLVMRLAMLAVVLMMSACAVTPYDYSALQASQPRSILVIPPQNNSVDVEASYTYLSTISRPLAEKGYYVFPVSVIDNFMKANGLPTPAEMNSVPLDKLYENIGADAVLYISIEDWGQKYQVLSSKTVVHAVLRLVDARTGQTLWDTVARAEQGSGDGGGGLLGAVISAAVNQIAKSVVDHTPGLSRTANNFAFNQRNRGLLPGPYAPVDEAAVK